MGLPLDFSGVDADKGIDVKKGDGDIVGQAGQAFKGAKATPSEQIAAWGGIKGAEEDVNETGEKTVKVWDGAVHPGTY